MNKVRYFNLNGMVIDRETREPRYLINYIVVTDDEHCKGRETTPVDIFFSNEPDCDEFGTYLIDIVEVVSYTTHVVKNKNEDAVYSDQKRSSKECGEAILRLLGVRK